MTKELLPRKPGIPAKIFRGYLKVLHDKLYYRRIYVEGRERMSLGPTDLSDYIF